MEANWIEWKGGECPVPPEELVEVKFELGGKHKAQGQSFRWSNNDREDDIIAYRLCSTTDNPVATARICCGKFDSCQEPCTPRGVHLGHREAKAKPIQVINWPPLENTGVPRFYLAGPMTGLPELNFPAFHAAAKALRATGLDIINPAELNADQSAQWADCMRADIAALVTCSGIVLLPGWENSRGANLELHIARSLGMLVLHYPSN
jgi:hypothetical protein